MRIVCYAEDATGDWQALLSAAYETVQPLSYGAGVVAADLAVVVLADPWAARHWLHELTVPLLLVTNALHYGRELCDKLPQLRIVCHPQRAVQVLPELVRLMPRLYVGALVLGPLPLRAPPRVMREAGYCGVTPPLALTDFDQDSVITGGDDGTDPRQPGRTPRRRRSRTRRRKRA